MVWGAIDQNIQVVLARLDGGDLELELDLVLCPAIRVHGVSLFLGRSDAIEDHRLPVVLM